MDEQIMENTAPKASGFLRKIKGFGIKGIILGAVALVAAAGVVTAAAVTSTPEAIVSRGLKNSLKAIEEKQVAGFLQQVANGGSAELSADLGTFTEGLTAGEYSADGAFSMKIYTDIAGKQFAAIAGVEQSTGKKYDVGFHMDEQNLAVDSQWLFGQQAYGVDLKHFGKNFADSEFAEGGEYDLGIEFDEDTKDLSKEAEQYAKDSKKIGAAIGAKFLKSMEEYAEITKEKAPLTFHDEDVKTTRVNVILHHEQLVAVITDMTEYLRTDEDLRAYLQKHGRYMLYTAGQYEADQEDVDRFVEDFYKSLDKYADDLLRLVEKRFTKNEAFFQILFYVTKSQKQLVGVVVNTGDKEDALTAAVFAGPQLENLKEVVVRVSTDEESYQANYVVSANDERRFAAGVQATQNGETVYEATAEWDKQNGDFVIKGDDGWAAFGFDGNFTKTDEKAVIFIENLIADESYMPVHVTLTLLASDQMPAMPKYDDVLELTADELETIVADAKTAIDDLVAG